MDVSEIVKELQRHERTQSGVNLRLRVVDEFGDTIKRVLPVVERNGELVIMLESEAVDTHPMSHSVGAVRS